MKKKDAVRIALAALVALAVASGVGLAQSAMARSGATGGTNCGRVGTWFGQGDSGITWMAVDTPGANATVGQFVLDWVLIDPTLGGFFPTSAVVTGAKGVWEKVNQSKYKYTWVAYGLDAAGQPVVVARASGFATMAGCNNVNLTYTLELFAPEDDIWTDQPSFGAVTGTAVEKRMPVVVVSQ